MKVENNEIIKNYLDEVTSYIKNKDAHEEVKLEVQSHILDIYYELINEGNSEKEAIDIAINRVGNPKDLGHNLNKVHKASPDYLTIALIIGIISIGLVTTVSLSYNNLISKSTMITNVLSVVIGSIVAIGIYFFDYRKIKNYSYKFYGLTLFVNVSILMIDILNGYVINGSFALSSKFSLLIIMCFLISLTSIIHQLDLSKFKSIVIVGILSSVPFVLQILIPRLSISLLYMLTLGFIVLRNIDCKKYILPIITLFITLIAGLCLFIMNSPYRIQRFISGMPLIFKIPGEELGGSYIQIQSMKILSDSSIFSKGFDESISNIVPVSELSNNLIFTYIVHSFGWFLAVISVVLIVVFMIRNFVISSKIKSKFGQDIVLLTITMLSFQFVLTILYSIGASSITYGMPFISIGSVNTLTNCMLIGLLSSVYRRRKLYNNDILTMI